MQFLRERNQVLSSAAVRLERDPTVTKPGGVFAPLEKRRAVLCLVLIALTLAFYNPITHDGFVLLDDVPYILSNPPVRAGLTWATVKWSFTSFHAGYWHPLTWLSHALDCQLFGLNPSGHHYVSLLFHTANAVLLFILLLEATQVVWPSLLVSALFALHPVNVESVAWAAERKNVLSMLFFLLALLAYGRYARSGGVGRYTLAALFFGLGLMAKPQIITLPCVLLLWDYWPLRRMFPMPDEMNSSTGTKPPSLRFLLLEKIPLLVIVVASSIITVRAQQSADAVRTLSEFSFSARLENAVVSYGRYLASLFWPRHLAPLYPHPENSLPAWQVIVCLLVLAGLTVCSLYFRQRRYLAVGWFWFLGVLVPMIGIVQVGEQARADRFVYIPMIGIAISLVWAIWEVADQRKISPKWVLAPAAVVLIVLGGLTYRQLGFWRDGETLWRYTLSVTQRNYMAHQSLAMALDRQGRIEEAIPEFRAAEALHNFPLGQVLNLGIYEQRNGHLQGAIELYQKVLSKTQDPKLLALAWSQSGSANVQMKSFDQAKACFENALRLDPMYPPALVGNGLLAERSGEFGRAAELLARAVEVDQSVVSILLQAEALRRGGRLAEAQAAEETATRFPGFAEAQKKALEMQSLFGYLSPQAPSSSAGQRE
jgi:Tfp pilus assembly protein PilF